MPKITYFVTIQATADGSAGIQDGVEMKATIEIPDKYDEKECAFLIERMKQDMPYYYYKRNVNAECKKILIDTSAPVTQFKAYGDNLGPEQIKMLERSFEWTTAKMEQARARTEFLHGEEKTRIHRMLKGVIDFVKRNVERIKEFVIPKPEPMPKPEPKKRKEVELPPLESPAFDFIQEQFQMIQEARQQKEAEAAAAEAEAKRKQKEAEDARRLEQKAFELQDRYIKNAKERKAMFEELEDIKEKLFGKPVMRR